MYDLYAKHFKSNSFKRTSIITQAVIILVSIISLLPYTICYYCMSTIDILEKER